MLTKAITKVPGYYYLAIILIVGLAPLGFASDYQVVDVIEGDIIKVNYNNTLIEIRLAAIDCPETGQPWGEQAKQFTSQMVLYKSVTIWPIGIDYQGRVIAWVFIDDNDLIKALLRAGLAWHDRSRSRESLLTALEMEARAAKKGLWSDPERIPPWEWREMPKRNTRLTNEPDVLV